MTPHNAYVAESLEITPIEGKVGVTADPGVIAITSLVRIDPTARITLLHVEPYDVTPGTTVVAVRASFWGRGTSPSGHQMFNGYPLGDCSKNLAGGFGPSYPVEGLELAEGDPVQLIYYLRSRDVGVETVIGYRIRYRTTRGAIRTVTGDLGRLDLELRPGIDDGQPLRCIDKVSGWARAVPGFPG